MKKLLFNEDGTIKTLNMLALIIVILVIAIVIIYSLFFKDKNITEGGVRITSKDITSTINMCKDCSMEFNDKELVLVTNQEYALEDILTVKNISIASVKFEVDKPEYLEVKRSKDNGLVLKTKDMMGEVKVSASYDKFKSDLKVIINEGEIVSLKLLDHPYYIYLNQETPIDVDSNPKGLDVTKLNFISDNEAIVSIRDGKMVGNALGNAKLQLTYNEEIFTQDVYVVNDLIKVGIKKGNTYEDVYKIKIDNKNDLNIIVTLDDNSGIGLTSDAIVVEHVDEGISGTVEYDGKNLGVERSYKYRIKINELSPNGQMIIAFKHPDGTSRNLVLYN